MRRGFFAERRKRRNELEDERQDEAMADSGGSFTIDSSEFEAALRQLEELGNREPGRVHALGLRFGMEEDLLFIRARRSGLKLEPSAFLRGFLAAFPIPADDVPEDE